MAQFIHWNVGRNYNIKTSNNWWEPKPEKVIEVIENKNGKILGDFLIQTDKVLVHNPINIIVIEKIK